MAQARDLTRVQRRAVAAITGDWREEYSAACLRLGIEADLSVRRLKMCQAFAHSTATKSRHKDIFSPAQTNSLTPGKPSLKYRVPWAAGPDSRLQATALFTRLESLAWSQQGSCRNCSV